MRKKQKGKKQKSNTRRSSARSNNYNGSYYQGNYNQDPLGKILYDIGKILKIFFLILTACLSLSLVGAIFGFLFTVSEITGLPTDEIGATAYFINELSKTNLFSPLFNGWVDFILFVLGILGIYGTIYEIKKSIKSSLLDWKYATIIYGIGAICGGAYSYTLFK